MDIHEYQAKDILKSYGVKIQEGIVADNPEKALELSSGGVETSPLNGSSLGILGIALYLNGRDEVARSAFDRALKRQFPPSQFTLMYQSLTLSRLGLADDARKAFDRGVDRAEATWPDNPEYVLLKRDAAEALGL